MDWSAADYDENEPFLESIDDLDESINYATESDIDTMPLDNTSSMLTSVRKRGRKQFITARLVAALDNAKVSDGMAVHILIAAVEALGFRVEEYAINRSTIHRLRQENRSREFKEISADFSDNVI